MTKLGQAWDTMSDIQPQQFSAYCREMSKRHTEIAKKYGEMAEFNDAYAKIEQPKFKHVATVATDVAGNVLISSQDLVEAVRKKSGRVKDLAERLHTNEAMIEALIEADGPVYKAERGWLKVRG